MKKFLLAILTISILLSTFIFLGLRDSWQKEGITDSIGENSNRIYLAKRLSFYHRVFKTKRYRTEKKKSFWKKAFLLRNKIFFQRTAD